MLNARHALFLSLISVVAITTASAQEVLLSGFEGDLSSSSGAAWKTGLSIQYVTEGVTEGTNAIEITHNPGWTQDFVLEGDSNLAAMFQTYDLLELDVTVPASAEWRQLFLVTQGDGLNWTQNAFNLGVGQTATVTLDLVETGIKAAAQAGGGTWWQIFLIFQGGDAGGPTLITTTVDNIRFAYESVPTVPFVIRDAAVAASGTEVIVTWGSTPGEEYTLQSGVNLAGADWADVLPFTNMVAVSDASSVTSPISGTLANYRMLHHIRPPIFFDDLEGGAPGWGSTTLVGSTAWELGTPAYTSGRGTFATAYSGTNAWGTGLTAPYADNDRAVLRTPEIDLTGVLGAVLSFYEVTDLEDTYDFGYVNILTNGVVAETNLYAANGTSTDWRPQTVSLNDYINQQIVIEFELVGDAFDFEADWFGWAIDDIMVTRSPPPPPTFTTAVTNLVLVETVGNTDLAVITEGATINLGGVNNTNLNVRAEIDGSAGSVALELTGATTASGTEGVAPYYLFGDADGVPFHGSMTNGTHRLVATPYEHTGGGGQVGTPMTVDFTLAP